MGKVNFYRGLCLGYVCHLGLTHPELDLSVLPERQSLAEVRRKFAVRTVVSLDSAISNAGRRVSCPDYFRQRAYLESAVRAAMWGHVLCHLAQLFRPWSRPCYQNFLLEYSR